MRHSLHSLWRANLLLCLALLVHRGEARVLTEAQAGPLYRVVGSSLSISCRVSGFTSESAEQQFEFRVTKPAKPNFELHIISTGDPYFGYASYQSRVINNEIAVERVSPTSVQFEIKSLQKDDEGDYDCSVVNSEFVYDGVYSVKTTVKVIDNSLSISSPDSTSLSFNEGEALILTCQASSNTIQHTHLSFSWYLRKDGEEKAQPIISLNRDFTLRPGQGFEGRYQAGLISLDKLGETTYRLKMAQLEVSDQGKIYCQAQEWIQDPDRSWYPIAQKEAEEITLKVKAREVLPDTTSLVVRMSAQQTTLQEGQELMLSCNIDTQNLEERFFSVAFLRGSVELARIGPTGVLSVGSEYSGREKDGELRATRTGNRDYRLILQPVRTADQGEYICRAWPQNRGHGGAFTQGAAQDSTSLLVSISATESGLSVKMQGAASVTEGDTLRLSCNVDGVKGRLSVTWQHKSSSTPSAPFTNLISLSQEGVVEKAAGFTSRKVMAARPAADSFILELAEVTPSDSGVYQCAVSEWNTNSKTYSQSQTASVTVTPLDSLMKVHLSSRNNKVTVGENVELMCRVSGPRVPITLTWSLQRDASNVDNILTLYSDGTISWFGNQNRYQVKVHNGQTNSVIHFLQIIGASHREAGSYRCMVSQFVENVHKKLSTSYPLAVMVQSPESKLRLSSNHTLTGNINTDIEIKCSVVTESSSSSRYSVTWLFQQEAENKTIVSSNRDGLITFGPTVELSQRQRISTRRSIGPSFEMNIRQARISDKGSYICEVGEWLQDPHGDWYQISDVSIITKLTVTEPANDLRLEKNEQPLVAKEGDEVELKCKIISGASSASFFYKVTWFYTVHSSATKASLVELDHTGLLSYPENQALRGLQERLRLFRPTQSSFYLRIQKAHEGDSGAYLCQVEQYQLDDEGRWQQKASDSAGPITLSVNAAEKSLSIVKEEVEFNLSKSEDLTIPCQISKQSSNESRFQVTWFWQKETETKQSPIFTAYRNSTLQDRFGKDVRLRFSHPLPGQFSLTVLMTGPENSGLYFCEVEEWLPSLDHGWRRIAVERSGNLIVSINTEGKGEARSESECNPISWTVTVVVIIIISLLVILILVLMIHRSNASGGKKSGESLWAEQPLKTKPIEED
ncbi:immunoglobulin superfamily member 3-like [Acanthochromis polyacanthus]|uniref:immunoglobulin superfamily member 3-like n=1 Tax=Acanthochromis polyacanthus TaxID=80966 RepID=UPI002234BBA0|nr:immunoglobulin superfamily member 3-like [Acanthochromis polyacanthus]